jgi:hypothetical protein
MDLLTTILACSLYPSDDALVRAIAEGPSQKNPYFVLSAAIDPSQGDPSLTARSDSDALAAAKDLLARGGKPLLGLLEIPAGWLTVFGRDLAEAFDPCTNIAIGSAMLSEFDYQCAAKAPARPARSLALERVSRRACVLRKYEAATGCNDFEMTVLLELSVERPANAEIAATPIFAPPSSLHWGPEQLLVRLPTSLAPAAIMTP